MTVEVPGKSVAYLVVLTMFLCAYCYQGVRRRIRDHRSKKLAQHQGND